MSAGVVLLAGCGGGSSVPLSPSAERTQVRPAYSVLHSFGGSGDGYYPYAGLAHVKSTLYGTTFYGGANDAGTVFSITKFGTETVLHSFGGSGDAAYPYAGLVDVKGTLYGTTNEGGANGDGTVFSITRAGTESVLYSFKGGSVDGYYPYEGVIYVKGTLYGTTVYGGANRGGTVFAVTESGAETVLHSFGGSGDGEYPYAGLVDVKGTLYGTTNAGGANGYGTVFSITPSGTETVLHSFNSASGDGALPYGLLVDVKGTLYGTTNEGGANGGGTVFSITPSGTENVLHSFNGGSGDGALPYAGVINVKDTLYGTTAEGGASGDGTVFSTTLSGKETVLYSFKGGLGDGKYPFASVINLKDTLYGTTFEGGANGDGTIFSLMP